jgi:DMSO reductase anchor subunit
MGHLPRSAYLRLLEYQREMKPHAYHPDFPLILFITFSRVASGIALTNPFSPPAKIGVGIALACMLLATAASIVHLNVPMRFLTMIRNNRSHLVWEVRLAGALTGFLVLESASLFGLPFLQGYRPYFMWVNFFLALLFLISTGWAYRFASHPAWESHALTFYYVASACLLGLSVRSALTPLSFFAPLPFFFFLIAEILLLLLYRKHLKTVSPFSLTKMVRGSDRRAFFAFLGFSLALPCLLSLLFVIAGKGEIFSGLIALSCFLGVFLERILFFRVERPAYFISFVQKEDEEGRNWIRG